MVVSPLERERNIEVVQQVRRRAGETCVRGKLTLLEEAVIKILPRWPEAYEAVMAYAEARAARRPRGGDSDERKSIRR